MEWNAPKEEVWRDCVDNQILLQYKYAQMTVYSNM